jgi:DNA-binding CsgD family transcriptional regulator
VVVPPGTGDQTLGGQVLLEREAELRAMADLTRDVRLGTGRLLLLEAPAGLGKSALLDRCAAGALEEGVRVLRARGHQLERTYGWGVARALFEGAVISGGRETGGLLDGPVAPARRVLLEGSGDTAPASVDAAFGILHALYWLVVRLAERRPLLLIVDDAHWADPPSLRLLIHLLTRISDVPAGVLVAARPAEPDTDGLLDLMAADPAAQSLQLRPLSFAAIEELVRRRWPDAAVDLCRRCGELTCGNPLQLREVLRAADECGAPPDLDVLSDVAAAAARSLERSTLTRLTAMTATARALVEAVAVFEDDVPLHLAAALAVVDPTVAARAVDELVRADVLRQGDPIGFRHPLLRAAVYGAIPERRRAETHRRAAQLLIASGAAPEQVCGHLLEAPATGQAAVVNMLRSAAERSLTRAAPASAIRYLERALREPPLPQEQAGVLAELGHAEAVAGAGEAADHLEAAIRIVEGGAQRAELLLQFGRALHHGGRLREACDAFRRGLSELSPGSGERDEMRAELEGGFLNAALFIPERAPEAHRRARELLSRGQAPVSPGELALLSKAVMLRVWAGEDREQVLSAARRLVDEGRLSTDDAADSQVPWQTIAALGWADDYVTGQHALRIAFADARKRGSVLAFALAGVLSARQSLWTGPIDDAVHDARRALDVLPPYSIYRSSAVYCLAAGLVEQGKGEEAAAALRALEPSELDDPPFFAAWRRMADGRVAAYRGEDARAVEAFLDVGRLYADLLIINPAVLPWRSEAALAARRLGELDRASTLLDEERALAECFGAPRAIGVALRAAGLLARGDDAVELQRAAVAVLDGCGARVEHARALGDLGAAVRRAGHPAQARPILRDALALAQDVGAHTVAATARAELRMAGGRMPTRTRAPVDRLTPGERRVAELAAAGQSNRQIANALFITVKGVEWHLGNVYRRLGVRGRADLPPALGIPGVGPQ